MSTNKTPGPVTQILMREKFDPRKYVEQAWHMLKTAPSQALRVAVAVISHQKNSKDGWLLLFMASIALWRDLPAWKKQLRSIVARFGIPKSLVKIPIFVSDHAGVPNVWQTLLKRDFADDEVMRELILTVIHKIEPTATSAIALCVCLREKAKQSTFPEEKQLLYGHAVSLAEFAKELDPTSSVASKNHTDTLAEASLSQWEQVAEKQGDYLSLLAQVYQPALDPVTKPQSR